MLSSFSLSRWWRILIGPSVEPYGFFCINFPASFSIWVHCARRTITHLNIARLALASDIPCAYRYRLLFPFTPFRPSLFLYLILTLCKSLTFSFSLFPFLTYAFVSFSPSLSLWPFLPIKCMPVYDFTRRDETSSINLWLISRRLRCTRAASDHVDDIFGRWI